MIVGGRGYRLTAMIDGRQVKEMGCRVTWPKLSGTTDPIQRKKGKLVEGNTATRFVRLGRVVIKKRCERGKKRKSHRYLKGWGGKKTGGGSSGRLEKESGFVHSSEGTSKCVAGGGY